jgi:hypothetical protein
MIEFTTVTSETSLFFLLLETIQRACSDTP